MNTKLEFRHRLLTNTRTCTVALTVGSKIVTAESTGLLGSPKETMRKKAIALALQKLKYGKEKRFKIWEEYRTLGPVNFKTGEDGKILKENGEPILIIHERWAKTPINKKKEVAVPIDM